LYVAFDAGTGGGRGPNLASYSGKLLRLNTDGTAPQDQPAGLPAIATDLQSPRGLDWHPETGALWIADAKRPDLEELRIVAAGGAASNGGRGRLSLPRGTGPAAIAFYRGTLLPGLSTDLLVASEDAHHLLRLHFDKHDSARVATSERLMQDSSRPIRAVATSADGTIFVATDRALIRFGPR
jgi:aldose sugar dehydrogenase